MLMVRCYFRFLLILTILQLTFTSFIFSQESQEIDLSQPLTLEQCVQMGLENATSIRNARLSLAIQELRVKNSRAGYFPTVTSSGRYDFNDRIDFGFEPENYDLGITGRYTLWDNGQREVNRAQSKEGLTATINRNEGIKQNLILQITQGYYDVLKDTELVKVSQEVLDRSKENTASTVALEEAGILIEADIATARVREANSELGLLNNENSLQISKATLPRLMGLDPGVLITVTVDESYQIYLERGTIERIDITVEEAIQIALENRPEFKETAAQLKQQEWSLILSKLQRWPRLSANANYNVNLDDYLRERDAFSDFRSWSIGASLNFTLFDAGILGNQVKERNMQLEQTRENASDLERSIALGVRQSYLNLKRSETAVEISKTQVINAQKSLDVIEGRFKVGKAIQLEVLDAQTSYAQALTNQVNAFYDYKIAHARLQDAMGVLQ